MAGNTFAVKMVIFNHDSDGVGKVNKEMDIVFTGTTKQRVCLLKFLPSIIFYHQPLLQLLQLLQALHVPLVVHLLLQHVLRAKAKITPHAYQS